MHTVYLVCLAVGGIYAVISILINGLDFDFEFDFDLGDLTLPIKPFTLMVFLTAFGGIGLIAEQFMAPLFTLIPSIVGGVGVSTLLYKFFYLKLRRLETETASEQDALMRKAEVVERIPPGGFGKISYVIDGNTISGPAKEQKAGQGIARGAKVYIMDMRENVYYVLEDPELYLTQGK